MAHGVAYHSRVEPRHRRREHRLRAAWRWLVAHQADIVCWLLVATAYVALLTR